MEPYTAPTGRCVQCSKIDRVLGSTFCNNCPVNPDRAMGSKEAEFVTN